VSQDDKPDDEHDRALIESTLELLHRARDGDRTAVDILVERCLPPLRRWAHGRLPQFARDRLNTEDLVQEAVIRVLRRLDRFDPRQVGALQAYLRQTVKNKICDEIRRVRRRPLSVEVPETIEAEQPDPLEQLLAHEDVEQYQLALGRISARDRELIIARCEMGLSFDEIAVATDKPSKEAARMAVSRAIRKLADEMHPEAPQAAG
jgi:RNA polymerase sigma-70 factor (ECF subfamily)